MERKDTNIPVSQNLSLPEKEKLHDYVNANYWSTYTRHTSIISDICRQLAFGEGSLCWALILSSQSTKAGLMGLISFVIISLVCYFACDLAQYISSKDAHKKKALELEKGIDENEIKDLSALGPFDINAWSERLFSLKILFLVIASSVFIGLLLELV